MPELVQQLPDGPIDFIGDVHGELEALQQLLSHLGYHTDGTHPEGRRLVFLGDLVDRGPDSPAVALFVRQLVINGNASCILGNHEMNVLLGKKRTYNRWLGHQKGMPGPLEQAPQRVATDTERTKILDFFRTLPVVLEHDALRVVHACWDDRAVEVLRRSGPDADVVSCLRVADDALRRAELVGASDPCAKANLNPIRRLLCGPEIPAFEGASRRTVRTPWWETDHGDDRACVFGHYCRVFLGEGSAAAIERREHPFGGMQRRWTWASKRTICVDFGISRRWSERLSGRDPDLFQTRLVAFRWPEEVLVDDLGHEIEPGPADAGVFP